MFGDQYPIADVLYFIGVVLITVKILTWEDTRRDKGRAGIISLCVILVAAVCFGLSLKWTNSRSVAIAKKPFLPFPSIAELFGTLVSHGAPTWRERIIGAALLGVLLLAFRGATVLIKKRGLKNGHAGPKGFLDYRFQAETAITKLPQTLEKLTGIMGNVGPLLHRQVTKAQRKSELREQLGVIRRTAINLDRLSKQMDRVGARHKLTGDSLAEGMNGWFEWISKNENAAAHVGQFMPQLRQLTESIKKANSQTQEYISIMKTSTGAYSQLDLSIYRHIKSVESVLETNQTIFHACDNVIRLFTPLPES